MAVSSYTTIKKAKSTRKEKLKKLVEGSFHSKSMFEHYQDLWAKEVGMIITCTLVQKE